MTAEQWLAKARESRELLVDLVSVYHPLMCKGRPPGGLDITARSAEESCMVIRKKIREESEVAPIGRLKDALDTGDIGEITSVLDETWFGVPDGVSVMTLNDWPLCPICGELIQSCDHFGALTVPNYDPERIVQKIERIARKLEALGLGKRGQSVEDDEFLRSIGIAK